MCPIRLSALFLSIATITNVSHLSGGQKETPSYQKAYSKMEDGNSLYAECTTAQRGMQIEGDSFRIQADTQAYEKEQSEGRKR